MKLSLGMVVAVLAAASVFHAASPIASAQTSAQPQLGAANYLPTPDYPLGWRGDGTGRFPAANPPIQWGRTIKGFYSELQCQAGKPQSPAKAGELLNMGFVRDWVIIGPFDAKDFKTGIDEEFIKDETTLQPKIGDKSGDNTWVHWHVSVANQSQSAGKLLIDFAEAYGKDPQQERQNKPGTMEPWGAYAQTSIWSPVPGKVKLRIEGTSARKAWLNGAPVAMQAQYGPTPVVELNQGWNNLVVKAVSTKGAWNFVALISPLPPYEYETKNIQWMTKMPGKSWCSPIIVGEKLFVSADGGTLVCMNKSDGKVLWMHSTTYFDGVDAAEKDKYASLAPKVTQLEEMCAALPALINQDITADGLKADHDEALNQKIKAKLDLENAIQQELVKGDKKKYIAWDNDQDTSKYNLASDGKYIWAAFWGGNKGLGANTVSCYDLNGKRLWAQFLGQTNISEHGTHCSPALCGDYLVFKSGAELFGFEKMSGKIAWQKKINGGLGASTLPVHIGKEILAYVPQLGIVRPSDGALLWKAPITADTPTPTINDGVIYGVGGEKFFAFKLPDQASDTMSLDTLVKTSWKEVSLHMPGAFTDSIIGSPLYDKGLVYVVSEGGAMNVIDAKTGKRVYTQAMDNLNPRLTWVFVVGICSSTTLGGKYLFVRDDQAQTLVLEPGPQYKELGKNLLVEFAPDGIQPESQSNFYFEGQRIYFRTRGFMYCIGEK